VIVDDFDVVRIAFAPPKADAPLVVHTDAELARPGTAELLEPVARRHPEVLENHRGVELAEAPERDPLNIGAELPDRVALEEPLRVGVAEAASAC
jgi:hypothetical protein